MGCQAMPPSCSPVPAQTSPRPCPRASELCSASAMLQGQGKLSRGCWCGRDFSSFLEMRDWDLLVHRLPWGVMHVVFIRRAVNCTDTCKPVSQMLLSGQQQAQLPGTGGPALSAAGCSPEHEQAAQVPPMDALPLSGHGWHPRASLWTKQGGGASSGSSATRAPRWTGPALCSDTETSSCPALHLCGPWAQQGYQDVQLGTSRERGSWS